MAKFRSLTRLQSLGFQSLQSLLTHTHTHPSDTGSGNSKVVTFVRIRQHSNQFNSHNCYLRLSSGATWLPFWPSSKWSQTLWTKIIHDQCYRCWMMRRKRSIKPNKSVNFGGRKMEPSRKKSHAARFALGPRKSLCLT